MTNRVAKEDNDPNGNTTSIERAETLDIWIEGALAIIYVVANVVIFFPAWMKQRRDVQLLTKDDPDDKGAGRVETIEFGAGGDSVTAPAKIKIDVERRSLIKRPTVHKRAHYETWQKLKEKTRPADDSEDSDDSEAE